MNAPRLRYLDWDNQIGVVIWKIGNVIHIKRVPLQDCWGFAVTELGDK